MDSGPVGASLPRSAAPEASWGRWWQEEESGRRADLTSPSVSAPPGSPVGSGATVLPIRLRRRRGEEQPGNPPSPPPAAPMRSQAARPPCPSAQQVRVCELFELRVVSGALASGAQCWGPHGSGAGLRGAPPSRCGCDPPPVHCLPASESQRPLTSPEPPSLLSALVTVAVGYRRLQASVCFQGSFNEKYSWVRLPIAACHELLLAVLLPRVSEASYVPVCTCLWFSPVNILLYFLSH